MAGVWIREVAVKLTSLEAGMVHNITQALKKKQKLGFNMLQSARMDLQGERPLLWAPGQRNRTDVYCSFSYTPQPGGLPS